MGRLRLRVDPPYDGESISSFVGRAAQSYSTPMRVLIDEITRGLPASALRIDLDRNPSNALLEGLSEAIGGNDFKLDDLRGFNHWVLAPAERNAYCPLCFKEDLAADRIPYFRNDWMAALTTSCWHHGTPLFNWTAISPTYGRRFPKEWVLERRRDERAFPTFFSNDIDRLNRLDEGGKQVVEGSPFSVSQALAAMSQLQCAFEKRSASPMMPIIADADRMASRDLLVSLTLFAIDRPSELGRKIGPMAGILRPRDPVAWFGDMPIKLSPREFGFREYAVRRFGDVAWRRTYLWLVARTLAGHPRFSANAFKAIGAWERWEDWWDRDVRFAASGSGREPCFNDMWKRLNGAAI